MNPDLFLLQLRQWGTSGVSKKPEVNPSMGVVAGVVVVWVKLCGTSPDEEETSVVKSSQISSGSSGSQQHSPSPSLHSPRSVPAGQEPSRLRMLKLMLSRIN